MDLKLRNNTIVSPAKSHENLSLADFLHLICNNRVDCDMERTAYNKTGTNHHV